MIRKYECQDCGSVISSSQPESPTKCSCGSKNLKLMLVEASEEEISQARIEMGKAYEDTIQVIESYMDMPVDQIRLVATWIMGTYFHDKFSTYPFLYINAMRGSGKTRLLRLISFMSKGSLGEVQTGITESVLFRMPPGKTLVLDECESIGSKEKQILREYLNACYKVGGVVQRMKKDKEGNYQPETFRPYKPIALANIWGIDEVLGDRCISFILEKSNDPAKTRKMEDFEENPKIKEIMDVFSKNSGLVSFSVVSLRSWNIYIDSRYNRHIYINNNNDTKQHNNTTLSQEERRKNILKKEELEEFFNKIHDINISGRNLELLIPLFFVSRYLSEEEFDKLLLFASDLMKQKKDDEFTESRDVLAYEFISKQETGLGYVPLKELTQKFRIFVGDEEWANERWLGRALKRLNLILDKRRVASGRLVMLNIPKALEKIKIFGRGEDDITV